MGTFGLCLLLLLDGSGPERALCLAPPLSSILVSDDSAWGLLRDRLLPDALRGTSIVEAAGILVPLGNLGSSGELLDLSAPELSLGGVNPDCIFYQGTSTNGSWRERMLKHLPVKQQDKTRTTNDTDVSNETRYWVCGCTTSGKMKDTDRQNYTRASNCSSPFRLAGCEVGCR